MNLANTLTLSRIISAPFFFIIYLLPRFFPQFFSNGSFWTIPVLWAIFLISEITDYFDGLAARKLNLTSDFGKLFDPFADTLVQLTYFLCFVIDDIWNAGIFSVILFLIIIYREFGILFIRNLMLKKNITLGARILGKIKTVLYIIAAGAALLVATFERLAVYGNLLPYFKTGALIIFIISVIFSVVSFIDYLLIYQKTGEANE
ncbi:MAG: CDP-diacylglycerol--glycerol-3-phosphate 3-phosphatidyltransferase [Treponema sp.]|nr:CDP-diacylglycerol--glycerol-3-phosphate 3-phosphatidyltransferase [Treponema sp.]MCL2252309.1 CDP-diacylglycerol--glycerol-3-phosphate 3-phosphatidyltransferase [Treponema sp.]